MNSMICGCLQDAQKDRRMTGSKSQKLFIKDSSHILIISENLNGVRQMITSKQDLIFSSSLFADLIIWKMNWRERDFKGEYLNN